MRERAQSVGGALQVHSAPGAGTRIMLHLPYATAMTPTAAWSTEQCGARL